MTIGSSLALAGTLLERVGRGAHGGHEEFGGRGEFEVEAAALVALLAVLAIGASLLWRRRRARKATAIATSTSLARPQEDQAIAHLRSRYANSEIERDDFLQKIADLTTST